ncbi:MAG: hypothetical protein K6T81_02305 [Alicyclobacillus macrosporangiidus]|uniref:hypothetical protein n=1 Tax=Alicyclobacillus macrosporangiidus TaxID=392015 RepID=UPI0026EA846C|nr:hypothetical protein [Alicyclobacillus macrosporangiidus]MCL6597556.1 hypothetical protein [Alicyclobacillus macrosporangiidus]
MKGFSFPKAVVYKEWRQLRGWLMLLAAVFWFAPVKTVVRYWTNVHAHPDQQQFLAASVVQMLQGLQPHFAAVTSTTLAALVLGVVPMSLERARGGLLLTLAAPVRRQDLVRVQAVLCLAAVWVALLLLTPYLLAVNAAFGHVVTTGDIAGWFLMQGLLKSAAFMVGFAVTTSVGNVIGAFACALGLAGFPVYVSMMIQELAHTAIHPEAFDEVVWRVAHDVMAMSPAVGPGVSDAPLWCLGGWYAVWAIGWYIAAEALFRRLPLEREGALFAFPALWDVLFAGVGLMVGTVCGEMAVGGMEFDPRRTPVLTAVWLPVAALTWFVLHAVRRWWIRRLRSA